MGGVCSNICCCCCCSRCSCCCCCCSTQGKLNESMTFWCRSLMRVAATLSLVTTPTRTHTHIRTPRGTRACVYTPHTHTGTHGHLLLLFVLLPSVAVGNVSWSSNKFGKQTRFGLCFIVVACCGCYPCCCCCFYAIVLLLSLAYLMYVNGRRRRCCCYFCCFCGFPLFFFCFAFCSFKF